MKTALNGYDNTWWYDLVVVFLLSWHGIGKETCRYDLL